MQIKLNEYIIIDNMQDKIKQINDGLKEIRTAISNQGVVIPDDTPLSEYASRINEISRPTITIGQQVFVFYCNAQDNDELEMKIKPSVSWNNEFNAWDVTEVIGGWTQAVPNPETDKYLHGLIVSVIPGQSTSDESFSWPRPIPIQGKNGEPGEKGDTGRDGVLVGAMSYHTTLVYHKLTESETVDSVQISKVQYHVDSNAPFGPESIKINDELIVNPESYWTTILDPSSLTVCAIITYSVMSKASEYIGKIEAVSEPFVLFGEHVKEQIIEYAINNDRDTIPSEWEETPGILTADNQYLWSRITTVYVSGENKVSDPIIITQYPKSIVGVDVKYGLSPDINTVPDDWENTFNQYENYTILWSKEITSYSDRTSNEVIKPIAFKGDPGISPIRVLATVTSAELESWTLSHTNIENQSAIIVDKKTYVWHGTTNPSAWTNNYHSVEGNGVTYYWVDLGQWFSLEIPDWNVNDSEESGYIKNRTHYKHLVTKSKVILGTSSMPALIEIPSEYEGTVTYNDGSTWSLAYAIRMKDVDIIFVRINPITRLSLYNVGWNESVAQIDITWQEEETVSLDPEFCNKITDIIFSEISTKQSSGKLIPGAKYRITDYPNLYIIVEATSPKSISKHAVAVHKITKDVYNIEYTLDNLNAAYILYGEPLTLIYNCPQGEDQSEFLWIIENSGLNISNYTVGTSVYFNFQIKNDKGELLISYLKNDDSPSVQEYVQTKIEEIQNSDTPILLKDTPIIGIKKNNIWYTDVANKKQISNALWYDLVTPISSSFGTILNMEYEHNDIPYDPFLYPDMPCNINGKFNKARPYFDKDSDKFIVYPINISSNNSIITFDNSLSGTINDNS